MGGKWKLAGAAKESLQVKWINRDGDPQTRLNDIPKCATSCSIAEPNGKTVSSFKEFVNKREELMLVVGHDVNVTGKKASTEEKDGGHRNTKLLRRVVSLMDVALSFLFARKNSKMIIRWWTRMSPMKTMRPMRTMSLTNVQNPLMNKAANKMPPIYDLAAELLVDNGLVT